MENSFNELYFIEYMPKVSEYKSKFDSLNGLLNKTTLTGKISSLEIAENLFIFMDETQQKFSALQTNLIKTLLSENFKKVVIELSQVSEIGSDMVSKLFLELDGIINTTVREHKIVEFLSPGGEMGEAKKELERYISSVAAKYKMVRDIMLFDKNGSLRISIDKKNAPRNTNDSFLQKALENDGVIVAKGDMDIQPHKGYSFVYAKRVKSESGDILGVVVFCINIEDEIEMVFDSLNYGAKGLALGLFDDKDYVVVSSEPHELIQGTKISLKVNAKYGIIKHRNKEYVASPANLKQLCDSLNSKWKLTMFVPMKSAFYYDPKSQDAHIDLSSEEFADASSLMTEELQSIMYEAENINEDLGDVVINGEIIASKSHSYSLNPILDNIRILSEEINKVCIDSIQDLQNTILHSSVEGAKFLASIALEMADRFFYFASNTASLIGQNSYISKALLDKKDMEANLPQVNHKLKELASLHDEYSNIFLADNEGKIRAASVEGTDKMMKKGIDSNHLFKIRGMGAESSYFISDFEKSELSDDKYGFVVYGNITNPMKPDENIGCIGVTFDTKEQFESILEKMLPKNEKGENRKNTFGVITTKTKRVIACSDAQIESGSILDIDEKFFKQQGGKGLAEIIDFKGSKYIVGSAKSKGYRGFNTQEHRVCELYAFVFIKI